jgi:hypothetical protein
MAACAANAGSEPLLASDAATTTRLGLGRTLRLAVHSSRSSPRPWIVEFSTGDFDRDTGGGCREGSSCVQDR